MCTTASPDPAALRTRRLHLLAAPCGDAAAQQVALRTAALARNLQKPFPHGRRPRPAALHRQQHAKAAAAQQQPTVSALGGHALSSRARSPAGQATCGRVARHRPCPATPKNNLRNLRNPPAASGSRSIRRSAAAPSAASSARPTASAAWTTRSSAAATRCTGTRTATAGCRRAGARAGRALVPAAAAAAAVPLAPEKPPPSLGSPPLRSSSLKRAGPACCYQQRATETDPPPPVASTGGPGARGRGRAPQHSAVL